MLQRLLLFTLTLCCINASAQWQQTGAKVRYVNGLGIPTKDTAAGVAADSSQILIRPADSSLYIKYKRTWVKVGSSGTIGGSGTTNYIPKFTSSTAIGNSQIFDNGTSVGIGTASPQSKLHAGGSTTSEVSIGTVTFGGNAGQALGSIQSDQTANGGVIYFKTNPWNNSSGIGLYTPQTRMTINDFGNVGIGYTTPAAKLSVQGTTLINTNTDNGVDKLQVSGNVTATGYITSNGGLQTSPGTNIIFPETSTTSYANMFRQASTAALVLANGYKFSSTAGGFASSFVTSARSAIQVGRGTISLYTDPSSTVSVGTDITPTERIRINNNGNVLINTTSDNGVDKLQVSGNVTATGTATAATIVKSGGTSSQALMANGSVLTLISGSYIPSLSNISNTSNLSVLDSCTYERVGNIVTVYFQVSGNCTASALNSFRISIPVGGAFTTTNQCIGSAMSTGSTSQAAYINSEVSANAVVNFYTVAGLTGFIYYGSFQYKVK